MTPAAVPAGHRCGDQAAVWSPADAWHRCGRCGHRMPYPGWRAIQTRHLPLRAWPAELHRRRLARRSV